MVGWSLPAGQRVVQQPATVDWQYRCCLLVRVLLPSVVLSQRPLLGPLLGCPVCRILHEPGRGLRRCVSCSSHVDSDEGCAIQLSVLV